MRTTRLLRSKSCSLARITTAATNFDPNSGLSGKSPKSMSPPRALHTSSTCRYQYHYNMEEEEDDDEDTMEEEEEEEEVEDAETEYLTLRRRRRRRGPIKNNINNSNDESSSPIMTPFNFIGIEEQTNNSPHSHQFPPLVAILLTALRKSLLVTCSVERDDVSNQLDISWPTDVRHVSHVTFDRFNGFLGLPLELQYDLPRKVPSASASVFGVSAQSMQCSYDHRGNSVPTILLLMQNRLYSEGGLQAEGIFRINAENSQEENVRNQLNRGVVPRGIDVHCLAGLIKAWFRELPTGVLDSLTPEQVMRCNTEEECTRLVHLLPPTEAALLDWAINLMADIVLHELYNKMNARNIAMVFAPNMTQMADPLTALIHAVQVMNFLKTLINKTLREREESGSRICKLQSTPHPPDHKEMHSSDLDVVMQSKLASDGHCIMGSDSGEKGSFGIQRDARKATGSIPSNRSPITCKSESIECKFRDGFGDEEVEEGIFEKLSLRKGVRKLCRHPVFQLSKAVKKKTETEIVNTRGGEGWM